jgi:hypothetical protein
MAGDIHSPIRPVPILVAYIPAGVFLGKQISLLSQFYCANMGTHSPCTASVGVLSIQEIEAIIKEKGLTPELIPDMMIKQITWDDQWIGYDDNETIALKTAWADSLCLGGTQIWSVDLNPGSGRLVLVMLQLWLAPTSKLSLTFGSTTPLTVSTNGICGASHSLVCTGSVFGDCCSVHGWCGSAPEYCSPMNGCQVDYGTCIADTLDSSGLVVSQDGSCGNGKTCLGSALGNCCSSNGWCGGSGDYCGTGCQAAFGSCVAVSQDGTCGNGKTCQGSSFGNCCSGNSWCGSSADYCGAGCQVAFGSC